MTKQLIIGLVGEGVTDHRFLNSIVKRTFEKVAFDCKGDIEILEIQHIPASGSKFVDVAYNAAKMAHDNYGVMVLCIHTDADGKSDSKTFNNKINPAIEKIVNSNDELCKEIVPVVPVVMSEAWMLADEKLFLEEIGSSATFKELGIPKAPEKIADPKTVIRSVIQFVFSKHPKRKKPRISELYSPIGQKAKLEELEKIESYLKFQNKVRNVLMKKNFLLP